MRSGDLGARAPVRGVARRVRRAGAGPERHARPAGAAPWPASATPATPSPTTCARRSPACAPGWRSALIDVEAGKGDPTQALGPGAGRRRRRAEDLRRGAGDRPAAGGGQLRRPRRVFDPSELAADIAELYEPLCEDKGIDFAAELGPRPDGARQPRVPGPGAGQHPRQRGEIHAQRRRGHAARAPPLLRRDRVLASPTPAPACPRPTASGWCERFVRLENSRNQPGAGLGLSLVAAVARRTAGGWSWTRAPASSPAAHRPTAPACGWRSACPAPSRRLGLTTRTPRDPLRGSGRA